MLLTTVLATFLAVFEGQTSTVSMYLCGQSLVQKEGGGQYVCVQHSHVIFTMWGMFSFDVNSVADTVKTRGPVPTDTHTLSAMITLTKRHIKNPKQLFKHIFFSNMYLVKQ
jgi:hypothetical protein